jgi:hypothetical protein
MHAAGACAHKHPSTNTRRPRTDQRSPAAPTPTRCRGPRDRMAEILGYLERNIQELDGLAQDMEEV